jgi:hypothetical protein
VGDELLADIADFAVDPPGAAQGFCDLLADLPLPSPSACPHGPPPGIPADPPAAPPHE